MMTVFRDNEKNGVNKHLKQLMYLLSENPGKRVQTVSECLFIFSRNFHPPQKKIKSHHSAGKIWGELNELNSTLTCILG